MTSSSEVTWSFDWDGLAALATPAGLFRYLWTTFKIPIYFLVVQYLYRMLISPDTWIDRAEKQYAAQKSDFLRMLSDPSIASRLVEGERGRVKCCYAVPL